MSISILNYLTYLNFKPREQEKYMLYSDFAGLSFRMFNLYCESKF